MTKLNLQFSLIGLFLGCLIPSIIGDTTNTIINVRLYETYSDCISQTNVLYKYKQSLNIKCTCVPSTDCYNKLTESSKFKTYFFNYNNASIYFDALNFKDTCYRFTMLSKTSPDIYIYNDMTFYQYCGVFIVCSSFIIICIIISIISINYFINKKKKKGNLLVNIPPPYQATI